MEGGENRQLISSLPKLPIEFWGVSTSFSWLTSPLITHAILKSHNQLKKFNLLVGVCNFNFIHNLLCLLTLSFDKQGLGPMHYSSPNIELLQPFSWWLGPRVKACSISIIRSLVSSIFIAVLCLLCSNKSPHLHIHMFQQISAKYVNAQHFNMSF